MTSPRKAPDPHPPEEQLTAYLLDELTASEMDVVDRHLASCRRCQETLARLDAAFVASVETLPVVPVPANGWGGIENRIRERTETPDRDEGLVPNGEAAPRSAPSPLGWVAGLAASLVLAAVLGSWGALQRQQLLEARTELRGLEGRVAALESLVGTVQARADELVTDQRRLAGWLSRDDVTSTRLPEANDGSAPGSVLFLPDGRALVVMRDVPAEGRTFQVWGARGAELVPLTTFVERTVEVEASSYDSVVISVEPAGGSDVPTEVLGTAAPG